MSVQVVDRIGDVKIYGGGHPGGKGAGLVKINECSINKAHKLRTRILTTTFYDRFLELDGRLGPDELETISSILHKLEGMPISVRSSATNEAWVGPAGKGSVHAGENTSFMLPNNHPDLERRFQQFIQAVSFIYRDFIARQPPDSREKMAIVVNPIPGITDVTDAGPVYYPLISGVANSYFFHAIRTQDPDEGFARIAFGHGYATVLDDFPVMSMATIRKPLPVRYFGKGQKYFYAINLRKNEGLRGEELETMSRLHLRFASQRHLNRLGLSGGRVTFEDVIEKDAFGFRSQLSEIMETVSAKISSHFQIEFVFNIENGGSDSEKGTFHVVQLTELPKLKFEKVHIPDLIKHVYLSSGSLQGHGIKKNISHAVVVSPFMYQKEMHDRVRRELARINSDMKRMNRTYLVIVPGRLGSGNRNWGIQADFGDVDGAAAIFEYGVDIAGRSEPVAEKNSSRGGIYGSHFLYMIQGGFDEERKRVQTRMYGTQGTHFLTNLVSNNVIYSYLTPNRDVIDPWFFQPPKEGGVPYVLKFPVPVTIYADSMNQDCRLIAEKG